MTEQEHKVLALMKPLRGARVSCLYIAHKLAWRLEDTNEIVKGMARKQILTGATGTSNRGTYSTRIMKPKKKAS